MTKVLGTATATFNGVFRLDIGDVTRSTGAWTLVDVGTLTETFGGTFNLAFLGGSSFTDEGGGMFSNGGWSFDTGTGILTVVPEPRISLIFAAGAMLLVIRRQNID